VRFALTKHAQKALDEREIRVEGEAGGTHPFIMCLMRISRYFANKIPLVSQIALLSATLNPCLVDNPENTFQCPPATVPCLPNSNSHNPIRNPQSQIPNRQRRNAVGLYYCPELPTGGGRGPASTSQ